MDILTIQNLKKSFGSKEVLCGLDMSVPECAQSFAHTRAPLVDAQSRTVVLPGWTAALSRGENYVVVVL